jgi:Flp pilus assembly protein TadD
MKPLEPPDSMHLSAAVGWLGLGNWKEAVEELKKITRGLEAHPDVLAVRQEICAKAQNWELAAEIAGTLAKLKPNDPQPIIALAYAVRRKNDGGLTSAKAILESAQEQFPKEAVIAYNLACYECQLGDLRMARSWLTKAGNLGNRNVIKLMALEDKDLEPLWPEIRQV